MRHACWIVACLCLCLSAASAQEPDPAMMERMMKNATPGEHHAHLKALAGKWQHTSRFRMTPEAPWMESKSESQADWILGGRFLTQEYKGEPMLGMPQAFEGFGILGYDNQKGKYESIWMDNMGTMIMVAEGTCAAAGRNITLTSNYMDPMTGKDGTSTWVYKIESADKYIMEMHMPGPDGNQFLSMEIISTRAK